MSLRPTREQRVQRQAGVVFEGACHSHPHRTRTTYRWVFRPSVAARFGRFAHNTFFVARSKVYLNGHGGLKLGCLAQAMMVAPKNDAPTDGTSSAKGGAVDDNLEDVDMEVEVRLEHTTVKIKSICVANPRPPRESRCFLR